MWNEQIVFSELVIFLFYSWIVWHDRLFSVLVWTLLQWMGHLQYFQEDVVKIPRFILDLALSALCPEYSDFCRSE